MNAVRLRWILPLIVLIGLTLLFYRGLAFSELILARGDTFNYFYPYWDARNEAFRNFQLPLWTDDLFMGAPLLANPQLGIFYPLNWITAPLRAPNAIKVSILLHSVIAGAGMAFLYATVFGARLLPMLTAAIVYSFSATLGAHVEQINQFQGLAWLPFLFAIYHRLLRGRKVGRDGMLFAAVMALQIFCGHTQTVFISGVGLGVYGIGLGFGAPDRARATAKHLLLLAVGVGMALLLTLPQLLPSAELMGMSNRGGGFNTQEATAFSLPPTLLGRALLPGYDGQLFGEYMASVGIIAMGLALYGGMAGGGETRQRRLWLLMALLGLLLALGRYNPIYLPLAELPGLNLFRVPARFLTLTTVALALLCGCGVAALGERLSDARSRRAAGLILAGIGVLILLTRFVLPVDPADFMGESDISDGSLALWATAWLLLFILLHWRAKWIAFAALPLISGELLLAAGNMPYNDLAPPDVYLGQRFSISQLLAYQSDEIVPSRTLSISQRYFDPGDIAALRARYDKLGMGERAQFHALDAVKKGETLSPNLALTWGIPSVDGFGGGITPTLAYSQFASLLLPEGAPRLVDGRLGERLARNECRGACMPSPRSLRLSDIRYLLTDKTHDLWHEGVAYDVALADYWRDTERVALPGPPYDEARILHLKALPGMEDSLQLANGMLLTIAEIESLNAILSGRQSIVAVTAASSQADGVFMPLQPPPFERVLSSDIKLYRFAYERGRAYLAADAIILPDTWAGREAALESLREGDGDVIHGAPTLPANKLTQPGALRFTAYSDTDIRLTVEAPSDAWLILSDAWYPGWRASVNGAASPIYRANVMLRAIRVPGGESEVVMTFEPDMWRAALIMGVTAWTLWMLAYAATQWRWRRPR